MKPKISKSVSTFKCTKSPVREIMDLANPQFFKKAGLDPAEVISFSGGWVNHESPPELREAYAEIIRDEKRFHSIGGYSPTIGTPECRRAIVDFEQHLFGRHMKLAPENIAIGGNSTQLTFNLMHIMLSPGDKLLLPDPAYCNYPSQVTALAGVKIIRFPLLDVKNWRFVADKKVEAFAKFIRKEKPKMILLCAPDNPTSQVPSTAFVRAALEAAQDVGAFLVIDFAYKALVWDDPIPEYFSWGPTDHFVSIHSNSKWCRGLGRRLGWVEGPVEIIDALEVVQGASILCPDSLHQMALADYVKRGIAAGSLRPYVHQTATLYETAAQRTVQAINQYLKLPCLAPQGGLYTVVYTGEESSAFTMKLLKQTGVIVVPGWGFGKTLDRAIRLSYGPLVHHLDRIDEAMKRIGDFLTKAG
ncbi:MAG TPA: pyridoxal phosphate-dependent aminotransferase [Candidatus Acidoferrum sp.]|nr:pyridoxal phosphate-dependent aminotransferase [Candidatus Acidoferrum sp.]